MTEAAPDPLQVMFSDDHLVVVSKPPGLTVHRGDRWSAGETFLLQRLGDQIGRYLYPVHRLDRNTS